MFPHKISSKIASCAYWADRTTRADLIDAIISDENDYTSTFLATFRANLRAKNIPNLSARIQKLPQSSERKLGSDACIVFKYNSNIKIGVFEAKWPRLGIKNYPWDMIQGSFGYSHFYSQLLRQSKISAKIAIWEMFYLESSFQQKYIVPHIPYGSSCVWHKDAYSYSQHRKSHGAVWVNNDLFEIFRTAKGIRKIIYDICICNEGDLLINVQVNDPQDIINFLEVDGFEPKEILFIEYSNKIKEDFNFNGHMLNNR